jgi:hypothetical protein
MKRRARISSLVLLPSALFAFVACRQTLGIQDDVGTLNDGGNGEGAPGDQGDGGGVVGSDAGRTDAQTDGGASGSEGGTGAHVCTVAACPPVTFQQGLYGPVALAVDSTHVYWIEVGLTIPQADMFGQLIRLPKTTTCAARSCYEILDPTVLAGELEGQYIYDTHIALGVNDVCYTQSFNANPEHSILCFGLTNGLQKRSLDQSTGDVVSLWIGGSQAAWAVQSSATGVADGTIQTSALQAGKAAPIASMRVEPSSVTSDGAKFWWTELGAASPNGSIDTLSADAGVDAGAVTAIATGRKDPVSVRLYGGYLYWIEAAGRTVMRAPADGSGAPQQIATTDENPFDLEVDATGVYWASAGTGPDALYGSVAHAPLTPGGAVTTMMDNIDKVSQIALDTTSIYIASTGTNLNAGLIVRMNKTY